MIMSVTELIQEERYSSIITKSKQFIKSQLVTYNLFFVELLTKTIKHFEIYEQKTKMQTQNLQKTIRILNKQIIKLKQDNSKIRNEYMTNYLEYQQLKHKNEELMMNNLKQEQTIKYFANQVEQLKTSFNHFKNEDNHFEKKLCIDFDDDQDNNNGVSNKFQGLAVIKEVSQHDLSCSMSLQSYNSQMSQDQNHQPSAEIINQQIQSQENQSNKHNSTLNHIQNYLDALDFLKNYNTASNDKFMKKVSTAGIQTTCRSTNISSEQLSIIFDKDQIKENYEISQNQIKRQVQITKKKDSQKRSGRDTIDRIKKMRRIEDTIEDIIMINQPEHIKQPKEYDMNVVCHRATKFKLKIPHSIITNENISSQNIIEHKEKQGQLKKQSARSIPSSRYKSRIKQDTLNLDYFVIKAFSILKQINCSLKNKEIIVQKKAKSILIGYGQGFQYRGHHNQFQLPNGYGKLLIKNECVYHGQWKHGNFHGWGKLILLPFIQAKEKQIIQIDGYFKNGTIQGAVICIFSNGQKFMGCIKEGEICEQGTFVSEKQVYTGYWQNSKLQYRL